VSHNDNLHKAIFKYFEIKASFEMCFEIKHISILLKKLSNADDRLIEGFKNTFKKFK
jgi:hypothetical protein